MRRSITDITLTLRTCGRLTVLAAMAFLPLLASATEPRPLRLASDAWPPFTDEAGRQRVAIDLVHAALGRAGIPAETVVTEWKQVERGINEGAY